MKIDVSQVYSCCPMEG